MVVSGSAGVDKDLGYFLNIYIYVAMVVYSGVIMNTPNSLSAWWSQMITERQNVRRIVKASSRLLGISLFYSVIEKWNNGGKSESEQSGSIYTNLNKTPP